MKFEGSKSRGFKKALAIIGALSVGATVLVSMLQINTASAAAIHKGCKSVVPPHYFDQAPYGKTAHYYVTFVQQGSDPTAPDPAHAIVCTKTDITNAGGKLSDSPNAPDTAPGGAPAAPAPPAGAVHKGCGKTVEPWFFNNAAHWYSEAPKADYSNAKLCSTDEINAAGGNPRIGDNGAIGPVGTGPAKQGSDTDADRQQGGSKTNPWPADVSLKAFPNGCKVPAVAPATIRVWKYLGTVGYGAGWYECDKRQIADDDGKAQGTDPVSVPGDANQGSDTNAKQIQDAALQGYKWAVTNRVSIRKANFNDACPPGYTVKDSDRTTDITWSAPNNGNWCNLVRWPIFLQGALAQKDPQAVKNTMRTFTNNAVNIS